MKARRIALKVLYWLAVLIVSLAIVFALVLFLESRDNSSVGGGAGRPPGQVGMAAVSRANTTIRFDAL